MLGCSDADPVEWDPVEGDTFGDTNQLFQSRPRAGELVGPHAEGTQMVLELGGADISGARFKVLETSVATATLDEERGPFILVLDFLKEGSTDLYAIDHDGTVLDVETLRVRRPQSVRVSPYEGLQYARGGGKPTEPTEGPVHTVQGALLDLVVSYVDRVGATLAGGGVIQVDADFPPRIDHEVLFTGELDVLSLDIGANAPVETLPITLSAGDVSTTVDLVVHDRDDVTGVTLEYSSGAEDGAAIARVFHDTQELAGASVTFSWDGSSEVGSVLLVDTDSEVASTTVTACFEDTDPPVCTEASVPGAPTGVLSRSAGDRGCSGCAATDAPSWGWLARRR